ncbi:hypothetical protein ABXT06_17500 [Flavobacterium sp. UW10123]|uniref:hypothetical protein n=1 Tax=Flavobacterium sp. UW10123 TaxID=3230800 RepID=UPI003395BF72
MRTQLIYKNFFIYCEKNNTSFYTEFDEGINIIHGKNTSGKSTLIQAIQYTFGINDEKHKLFEILEEGVIFRLDFVLKKGSNDENLTIIRDNDFIYIKRENLPLIKYSGIGANHSREHVLLKEYLSKLIGFNLNLESSGEYKLASLEAMFLPYYVSQDYGWVLALKSFRGLDFFRNFKTDYYDYYLGITNEFDRLKKQELEKDKKNLEGRIKFLTDTEKYDDDFKLSKLKDESFVTKSVEYIESYKKNKDELIQIEKEYLTKCNKLTFIEERLKILRVVKKALKTENPVENDCPTCRQNLPSSIEDIYEYYQDFNNTESEIAKLKNELKEIKGAINSLEIAMSAKKEIVSTDYSILHEYKIADLTFTSWLDNKTKIQLSNNILSQIGEATIELNKKYKELEAFKTDDELRKERNNKDYIFKGYFKDFLDELNVKSFDNELYLLLYQMKIFPKQGVELLKTLLAYYFAFNKLIEKTEYVHILPFMMDAVFKEDIDEDNRKLILEFIFKNKPSNNQLIFSFAESKKNAKTASEYNKEIMNGEAKLILTDLANERSLLHTLNDKQQEYLQETLFLIE